MMFLFLFGLVSLSLADYYEDQYGYNECNGTQPDHGWWPWWGKPKPLNRICNDIECPAFKKLNSSSCGFEARTVAAGKWVSTNVTNSDFTGSSSFMHLFNYINGDNDQGMKINMTAPVVTRTYYTHGWHGKKSTMHFWIPAALQAANNVPNPTAANVWIEDWPEMTTYDRAFGGFDRSMIRITKEFGKLCKALNSNGVMPHVKHGVALTAGYTMPFHGKQRTEVMLLDSGSFNTTAFWDYES